jgi:hypothetical protein
LENSPEGLDYYSSLAILALALFPWNQSQTKRNGQDRGSGVGRNVLVAIQVTVGVISSAGDFTWGFCVGEIFHKSIPQNAPKYWITQKRLSIHGHECREQICLYQKGQT